MKSNLLQFVIFLAFYPSINLPMNALNKFLCNNSVGIRDDGTTQAFNFIHITSNRN